MNKILLVLSLLLGGCGSFHFSERTSAVPPPETQQRLWVDGDFACRSDQWFADPDDCLAVFLARQADAHIVGISTVGGNARSDVAFAVAREIAGTIPVYRGESECGSSMVSAFRAEAQSGQMTILALGPLTNIATILRCDASLRNSIREIVFVGGRRQGQEFISNPRWLWHIALRDLNVEEDLSAVASVLQSGVPIRLVPFEAGNAVPIRVWTEGFRNSDISPSLLAQLRRWSVLTSVSWGSEGILPFDPVAVAAILWSSEFECVAVATTMVGNRLEVTSQVGSTTRYCLPKNPALLRDYILHFILGRRTAPAPLVALR
ncbi:nucleoside hydrolase [Patescibacteria group bacterium]|nr:nucleoside hydrolase [Patescibacteria group bacterium]